MLVIPQGKRQLYQVKAGGTERARSDPLFGLTTKSVCANCNNEGMNDLDLCVEKWVMNPETLESGSTPTDLTRSLRFLGLLVWDGVLHQAHRYREDPAAEDRQPQPPGQ